MAIKYTIDSEDVEWVMHWDEEAQADGKPAEELVFEEGPAIALLIINDVLSFNTNWWEKNWPEEARKTLYLGVDCSDVFTWGCSDSESIEYSEIKDLYQFFKRDPVWGPVIWCIIKRREMPQRPVAKRIRELGTWDLEGLKAEHNLRDNWYDAWNKKLHTFETNNPGVKPNYDELRNELKQELGY